MMRWGLAVVGLALLGLAWAIRFVSDAHGHGMASGDRRTMAGAIILGVLALAVAVWLTLRGARDV